MKNTFKWFVVIAIVAAIGFSMAACDDGSGGPGGGGGGGGITVTGIPSEYNGKYATVVLNVNGEPVYGAQSFDMPSYTYPRISGGSVTIGLWSGTPPSITRWNGSGTTIISVFIRNGATSTTSGSRNIASSLFYSVTITNGSANIAWSQGNTP